MLSSERIVSHSFQKLAHWGRAMGTGCQCCPPPLLPSTHCSQAVVRNLQQQMERLVFQNPEYHLLTVTPIGTEGAQGPVPYLWKVVIFWVGCFSFLNPSGLCQNSFTSMLVVDFLMWPLPWTLRIYFWLTQECKQRDVFDLHHLTHLSSCLMDQSCHKFGEMFLWQWKCIPGAWDTCTY